MTGVRRVKLIDVALAAGVHPGTASRALNPATRGRVSPETSRRVLKAAERLGYVPNQHPGLPAKLHGLELELAAVCLDSSWTRSSHRDLSIVS